MIRRKLCCLAGALCFWQAMAAIPAAAEVTLAVIAPKSGEYARAGEELFNGARLAVQEINDNGGLNGEKLDMLTIDDRCDDRLAVSTAEMLTLLKSKKIHRATRLFLHVQLIAGFAFLRAQAAKAGVLSIKQTHETRNDSQRKIVLRNMQNRLCGKYLKALGVGLRSSMRQPALPETLFSRKIPASDPLCKVLLPCLRPMIYLPGAVFSSLPKQDR